MIVSAVVQNVVFPKKLLQLKGTDLLVGIGTAVTTAITSPTLGFGCGVTAYIVVNVCVPTEAKKKVA